MSKDKALRMALDALEMYELETNSEFQSKAITAIKKALAQPHSEWVGLTDEEIDQICGDVGYGYINVARAIEAKLKEKNT